MLLKNGKPVADKAKRTWDNMMADGFCVSVRKYHAFLRGVREVLAFKAPKLGSVFKLEERARIIDKRG